MSLRFRVGAVAVVALVVIGIDVAAVSSKALRSGLEELFSMDGSASATETTFPQNLPIMWIHTAGIVFAGVLLLGPAAAKRLQRRGRVVAPSAAPPPPPPPVQPAAVPPPPPGPQVSIYTTEIPEISVAEVAARSDAVIFDADGAVADA